MKSILLARSPDVVARTVGKQIYALCPQKNLLIKLNATAAHIWQLLDTPKTIREIVDSITGTFDVTEKEAEEDVRSFVDSARSNNLISAV